MALSNLSLAVHLHIYYPDMWEKMKMRLQNIADYPYHLYVTMPEDNLYLADEIKDFHTQTTIHTVENYGYDIGPFIDFLNRINLDDYDLILKIHTKNDKDGVDTPINKWYVKRKLWFELLIDALIGSRKLFLKNLYAFEKDKTLGMVGSKYCITSNIKNFNLVEDGIHQVMKYLGLNNYMPIKFVAGTMFMVRSSIMKSIKGVYTIEDFMPTDGTVKDGTLAHIMERVFGCMVTAAGYKIKGFDKSRSFETYSVTKRICRFFYQKKVTKSNYLQVKILKIPVYHRKYKGQI